MSVYPTLKIYEKGNLKPFHNTFEITFFYYVSHRKRKNKKVGSTPRMGLKCWVYEISEKIRIFAAYNTLIVLFLVLLLAVVALFLYWIDLVDATDSVFLKGTVCFALPVVFVGGLYKVWTYIVSIFIGLLRDSPGAVPDPDKGKKLAEDLAEMQPESVENKEREIGVEHDIGYKSHEE